MATYILVKAGLVANIATGSVAWAQSVAGDWDDVIPVTSAPVRPDIGWRQVAGAVFVAPDPDPLKVNGERLRLRVLAALDANGRYLAGSRPVAATDLEAQVDALTRQVDALIRLGFGRLEADT